jgi:hypothetical protein
VSYRKFPTNLLEVRDAEISAHVFENAHTGLARALFWRISVEFQPMLHRGEEVDHLLMAEWVRFPGVRDWRRLDGVELAGGPDVIEASFYTGEHDPVTWSKLRFTHVGGAEFRINWDVVVDLRDWGGAPDVAFSIECAAKYSGVYPSQGLVEREPSIAVAARAVVAPFMDLECCGEFESITNMCGVVQHRLPPKLS